jgi:hypothetical protein
MVGQPRQGWLLYWVMVLLFGSALVFVHPSRQPKFGESSRACSLRCSQNTRSRFRLSTVSLSASRERAIGTPSKTTPIGTCKSCHKSSRDGLRVHPGSSTTRCGPEIAAQCLSP